MMIFLASALVLGVAACSDPDKREAKYIQRGIELFEKGEFQKARVEFRNAGAIKPTDPQVRYRTGLIDEAEGDLRNAFGNFMHAVEQDPHYRDAQIKLIQYYLAAEQYAEVEKRLDVVLTDHPDDADGHALKGALDLRHKDFDETEKEARFALQREPGNIIATSVLAGLYVAKNDQAAAEEVLATGIAKHPTDISLQTLKIAVYRKLNAPDKVEEAYRALFALKPGEPRFRTDFAQYLTSLGRTADAEAVLREGVAAQPANADMKRRLVQFLSDHGGLEPAEKQIRAFMAAEPKNNDYYFWLADLYVKHNAADQAVALLQEVAAKEQFDPPGLNARAVLARISFVRGDRVVTQQLVDIVLKNAPGNPDALFLRAAMAFDQGQYQAAVADLRSILRDHPKTKDALQMLAEALVRQGHVDLAIDTLSQLVDVDPTNNPARVRLAQMIHLNGDSKRALSLLSVVTKSDPSYSIGWESTARVAIDTKDWPTAEAAIDKLATLQGQKMTAAYLRGTMLAGTGKLDEAAGFFTDVVSSDPNAPLAEHALAALVVTDRALKRLEAASHFIETLRTDNPFVTTVLGECYAELGKLDDAGKAFDKLIDAKVARPEPYLDRARLFLRQRETDHALDVLKAGTAAVPSDIQIPMMEAELLGATGRYQDAEAIYDELLARNPALDVAANNLAELIADNQSGDTAAMEKARRTAERFLGASNPLLLDTLGWVYYRQDNLPQALTILQRAAGGGTVPPQVHYHYGAVLFKMGQKDLAKAQLEQATQAGAAYPGIEDAKRLLQSL